MVLAKQVIMQLCSIHYSNVFHQGGNSKVTEFFRQGLGGGVGMEGGGPISTVLQLCNCDQFITGQYATTL